MRMLCNTYNFGGLNTVHSLPWIKRNISTLYCYEVTWSWFGQGDSINPFSDFIRAISRSPSTYSPLSGSDLFIINPLHYLKSNSSVVYISCKRYPNEREIVQR